MKKLSKYMLIILTSGFFLLSLYIIVFGTIARKNNDLLSFFGYSYANVPTNSMSGNNSDSFDAGSFIITKKKSFESVELNDVVVFSKDNILIVHRVIEITNEGLVTKGDNNGSKDQGYVTKDNFKAVVVNNFMLFNLGSNINSYQLPIIGLMVIGLLIFLIFQIFNIVKTIFDERSKSIKENREKALKDEIYLEIGDYYEK